MASAKQSVYETTSVQSTCERCNKPVRNGWIFVLKSKGSQLASVDDGQVTEVAKCFRCALQHRPMLKRSVTAAVIVGTVLTILNQGDALFSGQWNNSLFWKIPLTYCVPLLVATYGALTNSRK
jgi:hypothetical protein